MDPKRPPTLVVCSILKKEVQFLCKKNNWKLPAKYLSSSLHVDFNQLEHSLKKALSSVHEKSTSLVTFGTCHPLMDRFLENSNAVRTPVQNCIELLLGKEEFTKELCGGAFFLLEEWAHTWDRITAKAFGIDVVGQNEIMHQGHTHLLCLRTPCSDNFEAQAEKISKKIDLPLKWKDVYLDTMEEHLRKTIELARDHQ